MEETGDGVKKRKERKMNGEGGDRVTEGKGAGCAAVVKVTSLPCEVEWYLNLTFVATVSTHRSVGGCACMCVYRFVLLCMSARGLVCLAGDTEQS